MAQDDTTIPVLPDEGTQDVSEDNGADLLVETDATEEKQEPKTEPESKEESKEEAKESEKTEEPEDNDKSEGESEEEKPEESEDESEESEPDPKEIARREYRERVQGKKQLQEILDTQWRTETPEELQEQGLDPAEARAVALEKRVELAEWRNQVVELNSTINQESMEVFKDYPVFDESSPEFDPEFAKEVGQLYQQTADLQFDETGQYVVNARVTPYDFYSKMAKLRGNSVTKGKVEGQRATEKNLAAAEPASTNKTTEVPAEEDPFLKGFNKGATN